MYRQLSRNTPLIQYRFLLIGQSDTYIFELPGYYPPPWLVFFFQYYAIRTTVYLHTAVLLLAAVAAGVRCCTVS